MLRYIMTVVAMTGAMLAGMTILTELGIVHVGPHYAAPARAMSVGAAVQFILLAAGLAYLAWMLPDTGNARIASFLCALCAVAVSVFAILGDKLHLPERFTASQTPMSIEAGIVFFLLSFVMMRLVWRMHIMRNGNGHGEEPHNWEGISRESREWKQ
jgi:hypothetical protein